MTSLLNSQTANAHAASNAGALSAPYLLPVQPCGGALTPCVGQDTNFPHGHSQADPQRETAVGGTNLPETKGDSNPRLPLSPAPNLLPSHRDAVSHTGCAGQDTNSQTTNDLSDPIGSASSAPYLPGSNGTSNSTVEPTPSSDSPHAYGRDDAQTPPGVGGHKPADSQTAFEPQRPNAVGAQLPTPDRVAYDAHGWHVRGGFLRDPVLGILADVLDDLETVRIANENRVRQLTRTEDDEDGENRGHGLTLDNPMVKKLVTSVESLAQAEKDATANLQKAMKAHPLGPWVKSQAGVGEKQAARLLATIGDPFWNDLHNRPRTVSELWAFCGYAVHDGHAQARRRGERSNWSADAKMRTYLIAVSCVKQSAEKSKYRRVYDEGRAKYADAVHPHDCKRCGPAGKPALAGSPLSAGHQHNRAIRLISKELLKDLWIASRDLYLAKEA